MLLSSYTLIQELNAVGSGGGAFGNQTVPSCFRWRKGRLLPSEALPLEERFDTRIRVYRWRVILHQPTRIGRRAVITVEITTEHAQHGHLLPAVMRRMRESTGHHPGLRPPDVEKHGLVLPPRLVRVPESFESPLADVRVAPDELEPSFRWGQRRRADINTEHRPKPRVLADALVDHVLVDAAARSEEH